MDAGGRATHGAVAEGGVIYNDPIPLAPSLREGEYVVVFCVTLRSLRLCVEVFDLILE